MPATARTTGAGGVSHRIANGATGEHTSPYGPGGSFVDLTLQPKISDGVECDVTIHSGGEVVLIDTCATARRTRLFLDVLDAATGGAPIRLAVNTHTHTHLHGNHVVRRRAAAGFDRDRGARAHA